MFQLSFCFTFELLVRDSTGTPNSLSMTHQQTVQACGKSFAFVSSLQFTLLLIQLATFFGRVVFANEAGNWCTTLSTTAGLWCNTFELSSHVQVTKKSRSALNERSTTFAVKSLHVSNS